MEFILSKLVWTLVRPLNLIVILILAAPLLHAAGRRRLAQAMLAGAAGLLLVFSLLPVGDLLLGTLEDRFPKPTPPPGTVSGVVVLGGSVELAAARDHGHYSLGESAERWLVLSELARRYPSAEIVFAGGGGSVGEAEYMPGFLAAQGIPPDRVRLEDRSRNTYENALYSKELVEPAPGETWLLVTSAWHMPRAVGSFRAVGWEVVAFPTDFRAATEIDPLFIDLLGNLRKADVALREMVGLAWYRLRGRSSALFPAPPPETADQPAADPTAP